MRIRTLALLGALCLPAFVRAAAAQPAPAAAPALSLVGAAFDEARQRLVIVGGYSDTASAAETWEWDGATWTKSLVAGPSPRNEPLLVYDRARKRVVLHGGARGRQTPAADTWAWDGVRWTQLATDGPARFGGTMVYDPRRDHIVFFGGGAAGGGEFSDTWEFYGNQWRRVIADSQPDSPPPRALHGMAYDEQRGRVIIAAGFAGFKPGTREPNVRDDTWEWDGARWQRLAVAGLPPRDHTAMVYDPDRKTVVLHSGGNGTQGLAGDSWALQGAQWVRIADAGPRSARHRLVYDPRTKTILSFGGWNAENVQSTEMWGLHGESWTRLSPR